MIYELSTILDLNLFSYISVRAGIAFILALALTMFLMPHYLVWAISKKSQQPINKYVPSHAKKVGTPTMGGIVFIIATTIAALLTVDLTNPYIIGGLVAILGFGFVGLKDDLGKILAADNLEGLSARAKMALLLTVSMFVIAILFFAGFPTQLYVPFLKTPLFDMGLLSVIFWILVFLATTNAVNLTDGLDGLATVPSIVALFTLGIIVYVTGHAIFSQYLLVPNIKGVGEVLILAAALSGALMGFLWYNCHPAEVFMGDTGSLSIGGFIAYMAILGKSELLLILIGIIFVIETLSVILQVGSYKLRGKRVFLMAPIHHHFEEKNWHENKIIVRFWMIAIIANILALISFKFR